MSQNTEIHGRLTSLDLLRAIAVLLVVAFHSFATLDNWLDTPAFVMTLLKRGGWIGVDLFFVLSGFLVSGLLFREQQRFGGVRISRFLARRGLKIYPLFYCYLGFIAVRILTEGGRIPWATMLSEALFVQNYGPHFLVHTWSLAVEEHFYILCSLLLFLLSHRGRGRSDPFTAIPWIAALVMVGCLAGRVAIGIRAPFLDKTHLFPTHLRLDGLMLGVALSYAYHFRRTWLERVVIGRERALAAVGVALLLPAFFISPDHFAIPTVGLTLFSIGSGLLILALVVHGAGDGLPVRLLAYVGASSYAIYLWHLVVQTELLIWGPRLGLEPGSPAHVWTYIGCSLAVGIGTSKLIELPVLRLRDRYFPSLGTRLPATTPVVRERHVSPALAGD